MRTEFNTVELNVLKNLKSHRYLSIILMIASLIGITVAIYFLLFPQATYESRHMNLVRLNSLIIMLSFSFYFFTCIRIIEKLQPDKKKERHGNDQSV